jgi:signal transduction histidine kinase
LPASIRLATSIEPGLPPVRCDRTQIARALTNLVENSLQAMPNGGTLTVTATRETDDVVITVADTGVGMDEESARRAFEPYFSTKTGGSGLGLANAKRAVESCGGALALATAPGHGTTVTMRLPSVRPSAPAPA